MINYSGFSQDHRGILIFSLLIIMMQLFFGAPTFAQKPDSLQPEFLRLAIITDKSLSTISNGVPQIKSDDLNPIFDLLKRMGGELAVGCISSSSASPLVRLYVPPPPAKPVDKSISETNIIRIGEAKAAYRTEMEHYNIAYSYWQENAKAAIAFGRSSIDSVLSQPVTAKKTDVIGAINRLCSFFAEPCRQNNIPYRQFAILITDGQHDKTPNPPKLPAMPAIVMAVPGDIIGILAQLHPLSFESARAAIRYIMSTLNFDTPERASRQ